MAPEAVQCLVCGLAGVWKHDVPGERRLGRYACPTCGQYYFFDPHQSMYMGSPQARAQWQLERLAALLAERWRKTKQPAFLCFDGDPLPDFAGAEVVRVKEILATWPRTMTELIERSFCNLARAVNAGSSAPYSGLRLDRSPQDGRVFFTKDYEQQDAYLVEAMSSYGWVSEKRDTSGTRVITITPEGWRHYEDLMRGQRNARNPAFVAMWFGGRDRSGEMTQLYNSAIAPAVDAAGYGVKRADTDEHNEPIMDRVIEYIRQAPFVVADLTEQNPGVYYEAGFARGLGTEVIYCFCETEQKPPHFDVSGINHVRYASREDLRKRLEDRILGTVGRNPYAPAVGDGAA